MINYKSDKFILVYQPGKVASRSIERSLISQGYYSSGPHSMGKILRNNTYPDYSTLGFRSLRIQYKNFRRYIKRKVLLQLYKRTPLKIITLVREPISRNISSYFHDLHIPLLHIATNGSTTRLENSSMKRLIDEFLGSFNHRVGIDWFDNELKKYFGVDVYKYDFDKDKGYTRFKSGKIDVLIIKYEKFREVGEECIRDFIGDKDFKINDYNVSKDKWYSPVYEKFKEEIILDDEYLDELLNNRYMHHFYTENEITEFYKKYRRNS